MIYSHQPPVSVGEMLEEEFLKPLGLSHAALADAMGVPRNEVGELISGIRPVTATTALILARVFGNSAEFWMNLQRRQDLWMALSNPELRASIDRARPLTDAA